MAQPMDLTEKLLRREDKYKGILMDVHVDTVELPNGETSGRTLLEIPAGKLDPGEEPAAGALRELAEETGAVPEVFLPLGRLLPSPGCFGETLHLFLARGLRMETQHLDPDEFLNVERIPFDEMVHRCVSSEIEDAKTVAAVLRAKVLLNL